MSSILCSDMHFLLLLTELYGPPIKPAPRTLHNEGWARVKSAEVLEYLLSRGYIPYTNTGQISQHIRAATERGYVAMVVKLLDYAERSHIPVMFSDLYPSLNMAIQRGYLGIISVLLDKLDPDSQSDLTQALAQTIEMGRPEIISYLLARYPQLKLDESMLYTTTVTFLLQFFSPVSKNNALLREATHNHEMFKTVLSDPRVDPMINVYATIVATWRLLHGKTGLMKQKPGTINKKMTKETSDEVKRAPITTALLTILNGIRDSTSGTRDKRLRVYVFSLGISKRTSTTEYMASY